MFDRFFSCCTRGLSSQGHLISKVITLAFVLLLGMGSAIPLFAQDLPSPLPPPLPPAPILPPPGQVIVALHRVDAIIDGPVAQVRVKQVFRNDSGRVAEGIYLFPLPKDAAVSDFQMTVNGKTLEGRLLDKDEARRIYEEIVRRQLDPALLEYMGRGLFQASVFPIPAGASRTVEFTYTQVLEQTDGLYRFNYPLSTRQFSTAPVEQVAVEVKLRNQPGLRTIYSPNYPILIERTTDDEAKVSYSADGAQPKGDFDLYFGVAEDAIGVNLLSYRPAGEDGFFVLLAAPAIETTTDEIIARDVVLVIDVSGSMQGDKIVQARAAAHFVVQHLNPDDRFNLVSFSTGSRRWMNRLQPVTAKNVVDAESWIDDLEASGSTDINRALLEALALLDGRDADPSRPAYILFLTDGQPTQGETEPDRIVDNARNNRPADRTVRLFTFGLGYDVNTDLLDILGQDLGGRSSYVTPNERIDEAVSSFYAQVSTPVLANVHLDFGADMVIDDIYPYPVPDLFAGEQLVLVGRYRDGGAVDVELTGEVNGKERVYVYPDLSLAEEGGEPFVARLWATRKVGALLDEVRRKGPLPELVDAITDLSLRYGIVTPYTSYLVEEPALAAMPAPADTWQAAPAAEFDLRAQAESSIVSQAAGLAAEAPTGEAAVEGAKLRGELMQAQTVRDEEAVRYVAGRTFKRQGYVTAPDGRTLEFWVDTSFDDEMDLTVVEYGSPAYFDLLEQP
ncbi:MAG: VWA domain-containing protein, partial [Caldilineaceae bacterium]|nr:VWA domain-containing protein [Caldilineaceae bacterium]